MSFGNFLNGIPVIGLLKGAIHAIANEEEEAKEAFIQSTRSTLVLGSRFLGAEVEAGVGSLMGTGTGLVFDAVHSFATNKPQGTYENMERFANNPSVPHFKRFFEGVTTDADFDIETLKPTGPTVKGFVKNACIDGGAALCSDIANCKDCSKNNHDACKSNPNPVEHACCCEYIQKMGASTFSEFLEHMRKLEKSRKL